MKMLLAILATAILTGCATITLDVPTKLGRATISTDGKTILLGLKK